MVDDVLQSKWMSSHRAPQFHTVENYVLLFTGGRRSLSTTQSCLAALQCGTFGGMKKRFALADNVDQRCGSLSIAPLMSRLIELSESRMKIVPRVGPLMTITKKSRPS